MMLHASIAEKSLQANFIKHPPTAGAAGAGVQGHGGRDRWKCPSDIKMHALTKHSSHPALATTDADGPAVDAPAPAAGMATSVDEAVCTPPMTQMADKDARHQSGVCRTQLPQSCGTTRISKSYEDNVGMGPSQEDG